MRAILPLIFFFCLFMPLAVKGADEPSPAAPGYASDWQGADYIQARLVNGGGDSGESLQAGVEVRLANGWHAYWRFPGDGGLAPEFDWSKSENVRSVTVHWPPPRRFDDMGLYSFGYENRVLFPLTIVPERPGDAVKLALSATIMVCNQICVPQSVSAKFDIPAGAAEATPYAAVIAHAFESLPVKGDSAALKIESAVLGPDALVVRAYSRSGFENADLFAESDSLFMTAPPEIMPDKDDGRYALLRIARPADSGDPAQEPVTAPLTLTLTAGGEAIERTISF